MSIPPTGEPGGPADAGDPHPATQHPGRPGYHRARAGPFPFRARPRARVRTVLTISGLVLLVTAGLGLFAVKMAISSYDRTVNRQVLLDPAVRPGQPQVRGPLNLLLIGSDQRADNVEAGQRSDTIIMAHLTRALDRAYLISIPRDLLVEIPAMPEVGFGGAQSKINAAFEFGKGGSTGVRLLARTLTQLTGVRFDGAAVIDFSGLRAAVNAFGGVRMCVDVRTVSIHTDRVFEKGCRRMDAHEALDYLRQRETLPDGDYGRQRHQQQFIKALVNEARTQNLLLHPILLDRLIRGVASALVVDLGQASLPDLLFAVRDIGPDDLTGIRLPAHDEMIDNISYLVPEAPLASDLFAAVRTDTLAAWTTANRTWVNRI